MIKFPFYLFLLLLLPLNHTHSKEAFSVNQTANTSHQNHLDGSLSPYLLQHADNPVDWYPWGEEAFNQARELDRPIFLSIGYSTCHWCHVMEHESFEDSTVAQLLNQYFVAVKVDREELPEVDHLYMTVCQALTGSGGWPLTIVMTPDKEPFFAGTYFPRERLGNRPGLLELLSALADIWQNRRAELDQTIDRITDFLRQIETRKVTGTITQETLERAFHTYRDRFDATNGGFGGAPKFPAPHNLIFLLRYYHSTQQEAALKMVESTLQKMRLGGLFDHIGYGFHRYSTDEKWRVPHFEKMLYDQALLALAYLEVYQVTGKDFYARTAREIFTYVLRDMTSPEGGFYSAEDADSEGAEGKFYLWTADQIQAILGPKAGARFNALFNVSSKGNFPAHASVSGIGSNIFYLETDLTTLARQQQTTVEELEHFIKTSRAKLFSERENRIHPFKDDKILTDWNGLMIAALAKGAVVLDDPRYLLSAQQAAEFLWTRLRDNQGHLYKRYRNGNGGLPGHLDDYTFFTWGLLELYEATLKPQYLVRAQELQEQTFTDFWDEINGGFFLGSSSAENLLVRSKTGYDGALPSGNSVAAMNLQRLGRLTGYDQWLTMSESIGRVFSAEINRNPTAFSSLLTTSLFTQNDPREVVVVGEPQTENTRTFIRILQAVYSPHKVLLLVNPNEPEVLTTVAPWTKPYRTLNGKPTAYVCKNYTCQQPTNDVQQALKYLTTPFPMSPPGGADEATLSRWDSK